VWITANIDWIMYVSGALTMTMLQAVIAPCAAMRSTFGLEVQGPLAIMIVRNWGLLVALSGALVIYGGYDAAVRSPALVVALIGKIAFIGLILAHGPLFRRHQTMTVVAFDSVFILLYVWYLAARYI